MLLPMPGLAADERHRARDEPAAEHPVELGDPGGPARCAARVDLGERHRGGRARVGCRAGGAGAASEHPHSPHSGQRPSHFGDSWAQPCTGSEHVFVSWAKP